MDQFGLYGSHGPGSSERAEWHSTAVLEQYNDCGGRLERVAILIQSTTILGHL